MLQKKECLVLLLLFAVVFTQATVCQTLTVPKTLGQLEVMKTQTGKDAQLLVDRLHRKSVSPLNSIVAEYQAVPGSATLYVSEYTTVRKAEEAASKMMQLIKGGNRLFRHYSGKNIGRTAVGRCLGMGQVHYVFQHQVQVYWLSVDPLRETEAFEALSRAIPLKPQ
jgi:hypothetical protein